MIDEELDLYLEDFANTISIESIQSVEIIDRMPVAQLDKVFFS